MQESPLIPMFEEGFDVIHTFKDAKEDDKISLKEWYRIIRELIEFVKATSEVKANSVSDLTDQDIETLASNAMNSIQREVKFIQEDLEDFLHAAKHVSRIILRVR